jgi:SAM-dependent methyltransferase
MSTQQPGGAPAYAATDGAAYEFWLGRWTRELSVPMLDFLKPPPNGALLDVGCGTGSLARAMAARWPGRRVCGIDSSASYVEFARQQGGNGATEFETGDATNLPYPDGAFAACAAQLVINFIKDADRALAEMIRVTQPGGAVAASVWDFRGGLVFQRMFWDTAAGIDPAANAARDRLFSAPLALPDGLAGLFERSGLCRIERASLTIRMDYANFDDYWQPLHGGQGPVGTYFAGIDPALRGKIESAVRAAYLSGAPDGARSLTATAWAVRGEVP